MVEDLGIIIDYLKRNFKNYPVDDIRVAFETGLKGFLDIKDMTHYHSFNTLYVTNVLQSYKRYKAKENTKPKAVYVSRQLPMKKRDKWEEAESQYNFVKSVFEEEGEAPLIANWVAVFKYMERKGIINLERDEKEIFMENVRADLSEAKEKKRIMKDNFRTLEAILNNPDQLKNECRKRMVIKHFENA